MSRRTSAAPYDVAIVGGGLCGFVAAHQLRHTRLRAIVIEARVLYLASSHSDFVTGQVIAVNGGYAF